MNYALHPLIAGTVGLWQMQGDLLDSSGLGHDLSVEVAGTGAFAALGNLQGYKFRDITANASSSLIVATPTADLRPTGDFTIQLIYQPISSPAGVSCFVSCADTSGGPFYLWYANSGTQTYGDRTAGLSSFGVNVGNFGFTQHWTLKKVGALSKLYLNGVQVGSSVGATNPLTWGGSEPFRIGKQITFSPLLDGVMASVRVLNYARSDTNIAADADAALNPLTLGAGSITKSFAGPFTRNGAETIVYESTVDLSSLSFFTGLGGLWDADDLKCLFHMETQANWVPSDARYRVYLGGTPGTINGTLIAGINVPGNTNSLYVTDNAVDNLDNLNAHNLIPPSNNDPKEIPNPGGTAVPFKVTMSTAGGQTASLSNGSVTLVPRAVSVFVSPLMTSPSLATTDPLVVDLDQGALPLAANTSVEIWTYDDNFLGNFIVAWTYAGGWQNGFSGTVADITHGKRVTVTPPSGGWTGLYMQVKSRATINYPRALTSATVWQWNLVAGAAPSVPGGFWGPMVRFGG